jgi:ABC-type transport system involved in multi-copper enzyme maturation permease subunit
MIIWTIAKTTFGEAMRKKILNVFLIVAVAMIVLSLSFLQLGFQNDLTTVKGFGLLIILLAGFIISLILTVSLIPNEMERRTIYTILSKPVNRYEFLIGKFLGGILTLTVNMALMAIVFIVMVAIKSACSGDAAGLAKVGEAAIQSGGTVASKVGIFDPSLLLGIFLIYLEFFLFSAVVMFFSVFLTPTVNFFASTSVWFLGSFSPMWQSIAKSNNPDTSIVTRYFYKAVSTIVPNFDLYNIQNRLIHPHHEVRSIPVYVSGVVGYSLLFATVLILIAVVAFDRKEV